MKRNQLTAALPKAMVLSELHCLLRSSHASPRLGLGSNRPLKRAWCVNSQIGGSAMQTTRIMELRSKLFRRASESEAQPSGMRI